MKKGDKVFVYGTLRKGGRAEGKMTRGATFLGSDTITGALIHAVGGWFPGLTIINSDDKVSGDVFEIFDDRLPRELDAYEGFPSLYSRERVLTDGGHDAWVYTYNGPTPESELIVGGDWLAHSGSSF